MNKSLLYAFLSTSICSCSTTIKQSEEQYESSYIIDTMDHSQSIQLDSPINENKTAIDSNNKIVSKQKDSSDYNILKDGSVFPAIISKSILKYDQYRRGTFELTILNQSSKKIRSIELTIKDKSIDSYSEYNIYVDRSKMIKSLPMITDLDIKPNYWRIVEVPITWDSEVFSEPYITWISFNDGSYWSISEN